MQPLSPTCTHAITLEYQAGGIARGENGIRYPNVTDHQNIQCRMILFCISNKNAFYSRVVIKYEQF